MSEREKQTNIIVTHAVQIRIFTRSGFNIRRWPIQISIKPYLIHLITKRVEYITKTETCLLTHVTAFTIQI